MLFQLQQIEIKDHPEEDSQFELIDKLTKNSILLTTHREGVKENWIKEIRQFTKEYGTGEEILLFLPIFLLFHFQRKKLVRLVQMNLDCHLL